MRADILILGANGQLGSDLVAVMSNAELNFIGITRDKFDAAKDDIELLAKYKVKYIINCIATTNVDGCEDNPGAAFNLNSVFVYKLAMFCKLHDIILIHLSTDYIFDGIKAAPYVEEDMANPLNIYGLSKHAGELALQNYHERYFIFRVSSLFGKAGASGKGGNFITTMQRLGRDLDSVSVIADQITCPTATIDIAKCITYFILHNITDYGVYNCVSSNSCSWFEFASEIFKLSALDVNKLQRATFANYKFKARRPKLAVMATDKLSKYYNMPTWQDSLNNYFHD